LISSKSVSGPRISRDPEAARLKEIIKDLKGVYVTNFEFDQPNQCSRVDVEAIRARLAASGWSRVMENWNKRAGEARWRKKLAFPQSTKNGIKNYLRRSRATVFPLITPAPAKSPLPSRHWDKGALDS
jgi:hypothetical protein